MNNREKTSVNDCFGKDNHNLYDAFFKRAFDIFMALGAAIVFLPLLLIIGFSVWIQDLHSPIFRQTRIGLHGKPFTILKFRSMRHGFKADDNVLTLVDDESVTPIGRFLRDHHLDELPQLFNVLRGDMSFVGYRPERACFIDLIIERNPLYSKLYSMRPGLFSYATLYNGYTDTIEKMLVRLDMDLDYLYNHSFKIDLKIIIITFIRLVSGKRF